jgi:LysM repeat protein
VGSIAGSILALRIVTNSPSEDGAAQTTTAQDSTAPAFTESAPNGAPSRAEQPSNRGAIRFAVQPIEPSYTVAAGDTLSSIARRFNTTIDALESINNLTDRSSLSVGQRLVIP